MQVRRRSGYIDHPQIRGFFFSSRRRHTNLTCDWSSDVCSSDLGRRLSLHTSRRAARRVVRWRLRRARHAAEARAIHRAAAMRRAWALALVIAVGAAGCAQGRTVVPVHMQPSAFAIPVQALDLSSYEATVRAVAGVIAHDLALPLPDTVMVYVYSSRQVFEQGLIDDGHVSRVRAAELSDF